MRRFVVLSALIASAVPAAAQSAGGCGGFKWPIDREQAAFMADGLPVIASGAPLPGLEKAATIQFAPQNTLTYPVPPTHKPRSNPAYGATVEIPSVDAAGTYQVTLSDGGWIDVVQNGALLKQTGFTDSKDCPSIRKSVRFKLANGPATIEISDAGKPAMKIDVLPASTP